MLWRPEGAAVGPVCLFAHFDADGAVAPYVVHAVAALRACGVRVVVVSACGVLADAQAARLRDVADALVVRGNGGLDFGSWQAARRLGLADGASHLVLANDSVFGPFRPLGPLLRPALGGGFDAWGMVESREHDWHLQSWFVVLSSALAAQARVRAVLDQDFAAMSKGRVIRDGEIGLGAALRAVGARCGAASRAAPPALAQRLWAVNRMHVDWRALAASGAVPYLKIEVLRDNPLRVPGVARWREVLAGTDYPPALIAEQLARTGTANPPPPRLRRRLFHLLVCTDRRDALRELPGRP